MKTACNLHGLRRSLALLAAGLVLALATGCASVTHPNPRDPWEALNRPISEFNDGVDSLLLRPVATVYRQAVPPLVRTGVANFFSNLTDVWSGVNSLLQFNVPNAAENFLRFGVNTFFGLGGILDIASELNIERHREDFGQTLGRWGVPAGPYVVLPLMGPSTLRDALSLSADRQGNLLTEFDRDWEASLYVLRVVDLRANLLRVTDVLENAALDKYSFVRDAHLQRRRSEIGPGVDVPFIRRRPADGGSDGSEPVDEGSDAGQPESSRKR